MKTIFVVLSLSLLLLSCQKEKDDVDAAVNVRGRRCLLKKGLDDFFCLDFNADYDANMAGNTCATEFNRYNSSVGLNGQNWLSGNANTCSNASNDTRVGSCTRTDGIIYYYDTHWNAGTAQTDCLNIHSGTWNP